MQANRSNVKTLLGQATALELYATSAMVKAAWQEIAKAKNEECLCSVTDVKKAGHMAWDCPRNEARGKMVLIFSPDNIWMLLVIRIHITCSAFLNSGFSHTMVNVGLSRIWKKRSIRVTTISGEMHTWHGTRTVKICTDTGNSTNVEALVVQEKPLNFDLLLAYVPIKVLGGVLITHMETVRFQEEALVCAVLKIDQPDFSIEFNQQQKIWTASWNCLGGSEPVKLQNSIVE